MKKNTSQTYIIKIYVLMEVFYFKHMQSNIIKISLKNTVKYIISLFLFSMSIAYITLQISMNIKYAIDGILFNNYNNIPQYIDIILAHNYMHDLLFFVSVIIILNFLSMLLKYFRNRITTKLKIKINTNLKSTLYEHVLNLEYKSYNTYDKTEIIQRINEDADVYSEFFNSQFNVMLDILFLSIFIIKESTTLNLSISIYIFSTVIIMLLFSLWYFKKLNKSIERLITKRKSLLNSTIINISNFKLVRMFNKQKQEKENYKKLNEDYNNENISFIKLVLFYDIILEHITYLKNPIIYVIGGIGIIKRKNDNGCINCII